MTFFNKFYEEESAAATVESIFANSAGGPPKVEDVLEATDCLQEVCAGNELLLAYLMKPERMALLVELMLCEEELGDPVPEALAGVFADRDRRARLAYVCSEIFCADVCSADLLPRSLLTEHCADRFLAYLAHPPPLPESGAYFSKVLSAVTRSCEAQESLRRAMERKMGEGRNPFEGLVRHIAVTSTGLLGLLTSNSSTQSVAGKPFLKMAMEDGKLDVLMEEYLADPTPVVRPGCSKEDQWELMEATRVGLLWVGLMVLSHEGITAREGEMLIWLSSQGGPCVSTQPGYTCASQWTAEQGGFVPGVLGTLLTEYRTNPQSGVVSAASDYLQRVARGYAYETIPALAARANSLNPAITSGLRCLLEHAADFKACLKVGPTLVQEPLQMQSWTVQQPFGYARLKILELLRAISLVARREVYMWFIDEEFVPLLMTIFESYPHNNLVHSLVAGCLQSLLSSEPDVKAKLMEMKLHEWMGRLYQKGKAEGASYTRYLFEMLRRLIQDGSLVPSDAPAIQWDQILREIESEAAQHEAEPEALYGESVGDAAGAAPAFAAATGEGPEAPADDFDMAPTTLSFPTGTVLPAPPAQPAAPAGKPSAGAPPAEAAAASGLWAANPVADPDDDSPAPAKAAKAQSEELPQTWISFGDPAPAPAAQPAGADSGGGGGGGGGGVDFGGENLVRSPTSPAAAAEIGKWGEFATQPAAAAAAAGFGNPPSPTLTFSPPSVPVKKGSAEDLFGAPLAPGGSAVSFGGPPDPFAPGKWGEQENRQPGQQQQQPNSGKGSSSRSSSRSSSGGGGGSLSDEVWNRVAGSLDIGLTGGSQAAKPDAPARKTLAQLQAEQAMRQQQQQQQQQKQQPASSSSGAPPGWQLF